MLTYDEFIEQLKDAVNDINPATAEAEELTQIICAEVADRISLYLNLQADKEGNTYFDSRIVRVAARIVSGMFTKTQAEIAGDGEDAEVKSISDNGQSISYGDKTKNYLATVTDGELFGGFADLLKPYRRINVIS